MCRNILIISLCLCIARLIFSTHSNITKGPTMTLVLDVMSTKIDIADRNNYYPYRRIAGISRLVMRMVLLLIETFQQMIMNLLRFTTRGAVIYLSNFLGFLASSDNNNVIYKGTTSYRNFEGYSQGYEGVLASTLSRAFMMPFKIIFGSLRSLPVTWIYEYLIGVIPFIDIISENLVVQSVSNATVSIAETVIDHTWNFTKANILPWMDKTITNLHKSNTLPGSIMQYLNQFQSFYQICHYLGIL